MNKVIAYIVIPLCLFLGGTALAFYFYKEAYITVIQVHNENILSQVFLSTPLIQGAVLRTELVASYDNLGAVQLRINTFNRINYNTIHFRLREKGTTNWLVSNVYVVDVFPNKLLYSFGFPAIADSGGRTYEVELSSENGTPAQSIGFYGGYHEAATLYVFPLETLLQDKQRMSVFVTAKLYSLVTDPYFLVYYGIFLVPTILYFSLSYIRPKRLLWITEISLFAYMIIVYIFLPVLIHLDAMLYIFIVGMAVFSIHVFRIFYPSAVLPKYFSSAYICSVAIVLVGVLLLYIVLGRELEAERTAVGIFYITLSALIVMVRELSQPSK